MIPSLTETLIENAKYIPNVDEGDTRKEPSACEIECQAQQSALVACMEVIRDQNQDQPSQSSGNSHCLAPSVAAWTECCTKANNKT